MITLSRDADKMISGFSGVVAIDVTHPPWPFKTPLNDNCSPIFLVYILLLYFYCFKTFFLRSTSEARKRPLKPFMTVESGPLKSFEQE